MTNPYTVWTHPSLHPQNGNLGYILCDQKFFCTAYKRNDPYHVDDSKLEPIHTLELAFEIANRKSLPQSTTSHAQSEPAAPSPDAETILCISERFVALLRSE